MYEGPLALSKAELARVSGRSICSLVGWGSSPVRRTACVSHAAKDDDAAHPIARGRRARELLRPRGSDGEATNDELVDLEVVGEEADILNDHLERVVWSLALW